MTQNSSSIYFDKNQPIEFYAGNLPHWLQTGKVHFVTFRLADSIPKDALEYYRVVKEAAKNTDCFNDPILTDQLRQARKILEKYEDAGYGRCILQYQELRKLLLEALYYYDNSEYTIRGYVIMPNHVHLLVIPFEYVDLVQTLKSVMKYSAKQINKKLNTSGRLWQTEPYDTIVRNSTHYSNCLNYIKRNPTGLPAGSFSIGGRDIRL